MGAVTLTKDLDRPRRISRHLRLMTGTVTLSSSYAAGGDTGFDPIPGATYLQVDVEPVGGYVFEPDMVNKKLKVFCPTGGGAAPTSIADPSQAATGVMTAAGADSTSLVGHTHPAGTITAGRGKEIGAADVSTLVTRYKALAKA